MTVEHVNKKWLTAKELGALLRLSKDKIMRLVREGMPCVNVGSAPKFSRSWSPRFSPDECLEWLKETNAFARKEAAR